MQRTHASDCALSASRSRSHSMPIMRISVAPLVPIEAGVRQHMATAQLGYVGESDCIGGNCRTRTLDRAHDDRKVAPPPQLYSCSRRRHDNLSAHDSAQNDHLHQQVAPSPWHP